MQGVHASNKAVLDFLKFASRAAPIVPSEKNWLDNDVALREIGRQARLLLTGSSDDPERLALVEKRRATLAKANASRKARQCERHRGISNADDPGGGKP